MFHVLFQSQGIDVNQPSASGETPLTTATLTDDLESLCVLLKEDKIQVNKQDGNGHLPLTNTVLQRSTPLHADITCRRKDIKADGVQIDSVGRILKVDRNNAPAQLRQKSMFKILSITHEDVGPGCFVKVTDLPDVDFDDKTIKFSQLNYLCGTVVREYYKEHTEKNMSEAFNTTREIFWVKFDGDKLLSVAPWVQEEAEDFTVPIPARCCVPTPRRSIDQEKYQKDDGNDEFRDLHAWLAFNFELDPGTKLQIRLESPQVSVLKTLLAQPELEVNRSDRDGNTALTLCSYPPLVSILLSVPDIDISKPNNNGQTALHTAIIKQDPSLVRILLSCENIAVNETDSNNCTPLYHALFGTNPEVVHAMLSAPRIELAVNVQHQKTGETPLTKAVMDENSQMVKCLLDIDGLDVTMANSAGQAAVAIAFFTSNAGILETLLKVRNIRAEPNVVDSAGRSPLTRALYNISFEVPYESITEGAVAVNDAYEIEIVDATQAPPQFHGQAGFKIVSICGKVPSVDPQKFSNKKVDLVKVLKARSEFTKFKELSFLLTFGSPQMVQAILMADNVNANMLDKNRDSPVGLVLRHVLEAFQATQAIPMKEWTTPMTEHRKLSMRHLDLLLNIEDIKIADHEEVGDALEKQMMTLIRFCNIPQQSLKFLVFTN
jgi:ankyrin repeat protein